ncbi:hypothetical protein ACH5RR_008016 [Cinchona calisaya]|uniref:ABC transporter domain-containing protein n=1 Tax=Cinchona calisaya TaxID=153742 RepID=A0ABD3ABY2_9GENT
MELLQANFDKEWLLMTRNTSIYVFTTIQIITVTIIASTVFLKARMHSRNEEDGAEYIGALLFSMTINVFNGFAELALTIQRLPVFYKHRDLHFYPPRAFTLPNYLPGLPVLQATFVDVSNSANGIWDVQAYWWRMQDYDNCKYKRSSSCSTCVLFGRVSHFLKVSSNAEVQIDLCVNEMTAPRWMNKMASDNVTRLGMAVLKEFGILTEKSWFWIGAVALLGFAVLFNILFTLSIMHLNRHNIKRQDKEIKGQKSETKQQPKNRVNKSKTDSLPRALSTANYYNSRDMLTKRQSIHFDANGVNRTEDTTLEVTIVVASRKGMILPFTPLVMSFSNVDYFVDIPPETKEKGTAKDKLQLLRDVTGAFRPGVLTALLRVSGAGKTMLMDVLSGRKTGGYIEGDIRISGFRKKQETFARISGYFSSYSASATSDENRRPMDLCWTIRPEFGENYRIL